MTTCKIPKLKADNAKAAKSWLQRMHRRNLLFCVDSNPQDLVKISDGSPMFTALECVELSAILDRLFAAIGSEVHDLAFDVVSRTFHTRSERRAIKAIYG